MRDNEASFDKISFNLRILIITSNIDSELKETCKIWCDWWLNFRWSLFRKLFLEKRDSSFVFKIPRTIFLKMKKKKKKRKGNRSVEFLSFEDSMLVLESSTSSLLHLPYVHQFPSPLSSSYFQAAMALEWDAIVPSRPLNSPTWKTHSSVKRSELVHVAEAATPRNPPCTRIPTRKSCVFLFLFPPSFCQFTTSPFFSSSPFSWAWMDKVDNLSTARAQGFEMI